MKEKRKFTRLKAPLGAVYRRARKGVRKKDAVVFLKDISGGGISFATKEALRDGDLLELEIQIPHLEEPVTAVAEVVWCTEGRAGVRFCDIDPQALNKILNYVHAVGIG